MPYKYGHYWVGFVVLVTVAGFWPSYFLLFATPIPFAFHVHAFTSLAWLLFLIAQSLTIHNRQPAWHRTMGRASFVLFPLLILGFVSIINLSASRFAAEENPFIMQLGPAFGIGMVTAIAAYLYLFYNALKHRRNVRLHAGYMLATPAILFESPFSRVIDLYIPWLDFLSSEGPRDVLDVIVISDGLVFLFAAALYLRDRKHGAPWLAVMFFVAAQMVLMWFAEYIPSMSAAFALYAQIPPAITLALGALAGIAAVWFGWQHGLGPTRKAPVAHPA
ncbi:hypothetical protein K3165_12140 [Qipengyuania sp. 1XM1-15A]|uniref:hypothetical protein n=1 Tax=Qipengyuania xiamenensis TaxID=2867237 RepID=UPI001C86F313|nr:hypothetical protein [Qipengyuania xiamenensis]MBX7533675.1 hypothetical protein [Qipengyuania xiamenensis]